MKNVNKYKDTLSQKTVEELVEIILRKDDKEKEKNKQISLLERKIKHYKDYQKDSEDNIIRLKQSYKLLESNYNNSKNDNDTLFKLKNKYLLQSKSLTFASILEFIIIFILIVMISL